MHLRGLGVRRAVQLAPFAYLASTAGCSNLVQQIILTSTTSPPDVNIQCATHLWSQGHSEQPPSFPSSTHQRLWDAPRVVFTYDNLLVDAPDCQAKSRLLAVSCRESGAWLNVLPISALGLRLANDVVRIAVGLRLGIPLCSPHPCCCCAATVEPLGTHCLSADLARADILDMLH